jgi:hypothetical protein
MVVEAPWFCAHCGAKFVIDARFCSACGTATAPNPGPQLPQNSQAEAAKQLPWHRNGNFALGIGFVGLMSSALSLAGLPFPSVGGVGAVGVMILGWRARNGPTRSQGRWAIASAVLGLILALSGILIANRAMPQSQTSGSLSPNFVLVGDAQFDRRVCTDRQCPASAIFRNAGKESGGGVAKFHLQGSGATVGSQLTNFECNAIIPVTPPGGFSQAGCVLPIPANYLTTAIQVVWCPPKTEFDC